MTDNILIVTAMPNPGQQDNMNAYLTGASPLIMKAGGELISRCKIVDKINGDGGYAMVMMMRFKDADAIRAVFASEEYKALIEVRDLAFSSMNISIGDDGT